MSVTPGVYNLTLNIIGKPNVAALGIDGVDLIESTTGSISKWIIRPISDVPANAYTIQNESTNAFVVPANNDPNGKLTFDVRPYAWFITGDLNNATISQRSSEVQSVNWNPNFSSTFVVLASFTSPTWNLTKA